MKVNNGSIFVGEDPLRARHGGNATGKSAGNAKQPAGKTIDGRAFAGKLDPIAFKKQQAQKKAMKLIGDVFKGDRKIDADLDDRRDQIQRLKKDIGEANRTISDLENRRTELRDTYGVLPDSKEETDLKLLEKGVRAGMPGSDVQLTKEETEAIQKIKEGGLTEYQQHSMDLLEEEKPYAETVYKAQAEIRMHSDVIRETKLEKLKAHEMVDANQKADVLLAAASKEIVSMLVEESKEHVDEEAEKRAEKAKEEKEKQEEIQERIDKTKEKKKEDEELTEEILEDSKKLNRNASDFSSVQQEVKDMLNRMKLVEEDVKGAAVDKNI